MERHSPDSDVLIVGGSLNGAALALALAQGGLTVTVLDALPRAVQADAGFDGRSYALALASVRMLGALGLWRALADTAEPIREIKVSDGRAGEGASRFTLEFDQAEIEEGPLGQMVAAQARLRPDALGARDLDRAMTFRQWNARACRLARKILQVVSIQNVRNRELGLPELELGLGIAFSRREPNFLYDEGRRIMISSAINQADRLSSCSGLLLRSGFQPPHQALRVAVVRDAVGGERAGPGRDLLPYNVNGVKLDEGAFLKLQEELPMSQLRLSDPGTLESRFFIGGYADDEGLLHWILLRHAPVRDWDGEHVGPIEPDRRHYFEMVVDEDLCARAQRIAGPAAGGLDGR